MDNKLIDINDRDINGKPKIILDLKGKDIILKEVTLDGKVFDIAIDKQTGKEIWQKERLVERIFTRSDGAIIKTVGDDPEKTIILEEALPDKEEWQIITAPDGGVYAVNKNDMTQKEKLFEAEAGLTWQTFFDQEKNMNILAQLDKEGNIKKWYPAKRDEIKKSANQIKIDRLTEQGVPKEYAEQLADGHISVETDGNLFYIVNKADQTRQLIKKGHALWKKKEGIVTETVDEDAVLDANANMNLTELNTDKKKPWLVPRAELDENWQTTTGTGLQKMDKLANVTRRTLIAVDNLHGIIQRKPYLIGYLGEINKWGQGLSGIPFIGEGVKAGYGAFGVDLDDDEIQEVNRLIREIESGITETKHVRGDRSPAVSTEQRTQDQMDLTAIWQSGKSVLPLLKGEFLALNRKFIEFQSVNPNNDYVEDWRKNPKYSNIVGNKNTQGNVVKVKKWNNATRKWEEVDQWVEDTVVFPE
tara:strand:+ start:525 stop:1943 length:1419 start_codon:yes stop_codon:yes gene_type:complete